MTRDAMHELGLERDPTLPLSFPAAEEKIDANCLEPVELAAFLSAIPVEPELAAALDEHRAMLLADQAPGLAEGWMFPSSAGTLRTPSSLYKAWRRYMEVTGIARRFTVHGMRRYTFTDLVLRANVDAVVRRALTGHVTERMQRHYAHVGNDEKRAALAGVLRLVPPASSPAPTDLGGGFSGDRPGQPHNGRRAQGARRPDLPGAGHGGRNPRPSAWESGKTPSSDRYLRLDTGDDLSPGIPFQPVSTRE